MQQDKINEAGTSSNTDSLKNQDEQSGKPGDGSRAYLDINDAAGASTHGDADKKKAKDKERK